MRGFEMFSLCSCVSVFFFLAVFSATKRRISSSVEGNVRIYY